MKDSAYEVVADEGYFAAAITGRVDNCGDVFLAQGEDLILISAEQLKAVRKFLKGAKVIV